MTREEFAKELNAFLSAYDRYVVVGHVKPDGDSVGACIAMGLALKARGKEVYVFYDGDVERYRPVADCVPVITPEISEKLANAPYACILLDLSDPERTGAGVSLFEKAADSLCIDHHVFQGTFARLNHIESGMSATSEILYHLFVIMGVPITHEMAEALYLGVAFDSGGFRHSSTTGDTYRMAGAMVDAGVSCTDVMNKLYHTRSFHEIKILSEVFRKARLYKGGIVVAALESKDYLKLGASPDEAEGVVSYLAEVAEAEVAVYLREVDGGAIRANLRSKEKVDVAAVARQFKGGGHKRAAGCTLEGPMLLAKQTLLKAIKEQME